MDLPPQPDPTTEDPEIIPGGVDAVDELDPHPVPRDPVPADNPATDDEVPDEIQEPDDKQQEPEEGEEKRSEPAD